MKLQIAIDRVPLDQAESFARKLAPYSDILEAGTSLIKDYGVQALAALKKAAPDTALLGDMKTIDEGDYEFRQGYRSGADILTVMGASSVATIEKCYRVAEQTGREMMIDLLECAPETIGRISDFSNAIYCLHTSVDKGATADPNGDILAFKKRFPSVRRIAIAGGINLGSIEKLKESSPEIVIVGSGITKAGDPALAAQNFRKAMA
ncbi:orotidine 5'-phosphate decarboxylase / HUMPS family protein [Sporolactobacillus putidus]|uniref:3-hexulose-6-phosphate synthase n=1 Tax=Sporolactobacillus putidus TaxID=492735 RepID=A0A917S9H7_9BACL|nr:orotidine 5'-phosphate decarboxylase / HUMPS family protein [Sporolactobacillus putidus]GGL65845.1 3-hexulose-6-phosphate synthase [Sporolactobacillus putidus]